ncbi:GNAT family N-acetyltransferase [Microvirga sp. 0TCS3.31]
MSTRDVHVRPAGAEDLPWVADLVRGSFDPHLLPYLVAAQSGIVSWWRTILDHSDSFPTTRFLVAEDGAGRRLGYAELKQLDDRTGFLSYVAVAAEARGAGVAGRLVAAYLGERPHLEAMELDVFEDNAPARALYARLGFEESARSTWWAAPLEHDPDGPGGRPVGDLHAVLARHRAYGFTDLTVDAGGSAVRFGVLGEEVLRCFTAESFVDADAQAVVREVFPHLTRRFAVLAEGADLASSGAVPLVRSLRMRSDHVAELLEDA